MILKNYAIVTKTNRGLLYRHEFKAFNYYHALLVKIAWLRKYKHAYKNLPTFIIQTDD